MGQNLNSFKKLGLEDNINETSNTKHFVSVSEKRASTAELTLLNVNLNLHVQSILIRNFRNWGSYLFVHQLKKFVFLVEKLSVIGWLTFT